MRPKKFKDYLAKRLDQTEIQELEQQAQIEQEALQMLQTDISKAVTNYMQKEEIGFNELVRRLGVSAAQAVKIQKGEANLTLASLAHIAALLKLKPHVTFK